MVARIGLWDALDRAGFNRKEGGDLPKGLEVLSERAEYCGYVEFPDEKLYLVAAIPVDAMGRGQ